MIIDKIDNASLYYGLGKRITSALRFLSENDLAKMDPGKYEIDGANIFASIMNYESKPAVQGFWEVHRQYIDVQYVAEGIERIGYAHMNDLTADGPYDTEKDFQKLKGDGGNFFVMRTGTFVILWPHDAHMPGLTLTTPLPVKKIVVKVLVQ
jgi:YhcH/YjgK/YiaL family protein